MTYKSKKTRLSRPTGSHEQETGSFPRDGFLVEICVDEDGEQ